MRRARWIIRPQVSQVSDDSAAAKPVKPVKPIIYHCISRAVNREFVFGDLERERQRMFMRMYENFSGCLVLAYCYMSNHLHILLEVTPPPAGGLSDAELLRRVGALGNTGQVAELVTELAAARKKIRQGEAAESLVAAIHARFTYRMHDLSEFMKGFMQRYTQWHNRTHQRTGRLWEDRFKSVIVEDGVTCKTVAAYIDLNPVRAGMVKDPADYRWSSYGEAIGGGPRGNGKKARAGLVRALRAHKGVAADAELWAHDVAREYRRILLAGAVEKLAAKVVRNGTSGTSATSTVVRTRRGMTASQVREEQQRAADELLEIPVGRMLRRRIRYFTDGAVLGSRDFVNAAFTSARERFGGKRRDGARKLRGAAAAGAGVIWSARDLRRGV